MPTKPLITAERLREVLDYDPGTGVFTRRLRIGRSTAIGDQAGGQSHGYIELSVDGRKYSAHRLVWLYMTGAWPCEEIDHINRDKADNRFANLREATRSQNNRNMAIRSNNKCGFKGVRWQKTGYWQARIKVDGREISLGYFKEIEPAARAYEEASRKYHGDFGSP